MAKKDDPYINEDTWDVTTKNPNFLEGLLIGIMMLISALFFRKPQ
jgi:hypothetical protein